LGVFFGVSAADAATLHAVLEDHCDYKRRFCDSAMQTHTINPYVVNTEYRCEGMIQKLKGYRLFKKKETVVSETAEESEKAASKKWMDNAMWDSLHERDAGTTRDFRLALLQSDKYFKCTYFLDEKLLTCYTTLRPQDNYLHKVKCGFMPRYTNHVWNPDKLEIYVPLNDPKVLWHTYRMMDKSTDESLAIYNKIKADREAWKKSPAGKQDQRDRGVTEIDPWIE
jgi:hypothetical protein